MAAATTILAATAVAASAGGGIGDMIGGAKQKRQAKKLARDFRRQELRNLADQRSVSTVGTDIARQEMARGTANSIDALRAGGVRGVVGGIGAVQETNTRGAQQIGLNLDAQLQQLQQERMLEASNIRGIQEARDNQELANIQAMHNAGQAQMQNGIKGVIGGAGAAAGGIASGSLGGGVSAAGAGNAGLTVPTMSSPLAVLGSGQLDPSILPMASYVSVPKIPDNGRS